jgi:hypothetical protein
MSPAFQLDSSLQGRGAVAFAVSVLQRVTWRAVLATQCLSCLLALQFALERWQQPGQPGLLESVLRYAITALLVMLAAFAADEAVRRGSSVWRAFVIALLGASAVNVVAQSLTSGALGEGISQRGLLKTLYDFLEVGGVWGTVMMVYLNRQSARRLLARLRTTELERAEAERRLIASRLAATESQIDPSAVLNQLARVRNLYATGHPEADERFEALIVGLREVVARTTAVQAYDESA